MEDQKEYLYRYEEIRWSLGLDEFDNPIQGCRLEVSLSKYEIAKRTPKGAWVYRYSFTSDKKFVNLSAKKKFACESIEEAKESFLRRKERQIQILSSQLKEAKKAKSIIENMIEKEIDKQSSTIGLFL